MQRALVTGASGFIGGHLIEALQQRGVATRCLVRATSQRGLLEQSGAELVECSLTDREGLRRALQAVDVVFHLAARTTALHERQLMEVNAGGTATLAQACALQTTPPRVIYVSSVAAAGPVRRGRVRSEADPPAPISNYGRSKRAGELALARWAAQLPATIVRPGIVFGPRNRELFPAFQAIQRTRTHVIPTFAPPPLSMIDVRDLVPLLLAAAERGRRLPLHADQATTGEGYYFAACPEYPDYKQLGKRIALALGIPRVLYLHMAQPLPWIIGGISQFAGAAVGKVPAVNVDKMREASAPSWACSSAAAERDLDVRWPQSLNEQLRSTAEWYREHGWLPGNSGLRPRA